MSLPRELPDELLSAYMDGELSADERARVEQMLAADPEMRESLRLLQEQSQTLRHSLRSAPQLDAAFAERVLAATFAEAQRQSLDASHPVQKAAAERFSSRDHTVLHAGTPAHSGNLGRRHFVAGLAIAAGLVLAAVFYLDPGDDRPLATDDLRNQPGQNSQAGDEIAAGGPAQMSGPQGAQGRGEAGTVPPLRQTVDAALPKTEDLLPDAAPQSTVAGSATPAEPVERLAASEPDSSRLDSTAANDRVDRSVAAEQAPRMATRTPAAEAVADSLPSDQVALRAVLVYEVSLTPLGRERNVINRALREAQIRTADQREIDESLASYLRSGGLIGAAEHDQAAEGTAGDDATVSVLFLEGSGRRLEKLMMTLLMAKEEVHSVGFSLAMDPPVMAAVDSLRKVEPTKIRGDVTSVVAQPLAPAGVPGSLKGFTAGSRRFAPLRRDSFPTMAGLSGGTSDEQPDITAMTFLVIRSQPDE